MTDIQNDRELFRFIRDAEIPDLPPLNEIISRQSIRTANVSEVLESVRNDRHRVLIIDARSESEFSESKLPDAINFPVLTDAERHNVGLLYTKYSRKAALWLAMKYADPKIDTLKQFLIDNSASDKKLFVYCWRGGGRSGYLSKMISQLGYFPNVVSGGHKAFRKSVVDFFSSPKFPSGLLVLTGLTGSGKTELLRSASELLPSIDLEYCAMHYSSLLGRIPYDLKGELKIKKQSAFENRLFSEILLGMSSQKPEDEIYLIESESRKVGDFLIPSMLFESMNEAPCVRVTATIENRIGRLCRDYFMGSEKRVEPMQVLIQKKESFFRQQLSNKIYDKVLQLLSDGNTEEFTEIMLIEYYDKRYKNKGKTPLAEVNSDNLNESVQTLRDVHNRLKAGKKN